MSPGDRGRVMAIMAAARDILELVIILETEDRGPGLGELCPLVMGEEGDEVVRSVTRILLEATMDMWGLPEYEEMRNKCRM